LDVAEEKSFKNASLGGGGLEGESYSLLWKGGILERVDVFTGYFYRLESDVVASEEVFWSFGV